MRKFLIVVLGNIGEKYVNTRHNIGFQVLDALAKDQDASFETEKLIENLKSFVDALIKAKPTGAKGNYILKTSLSTTQGIGLTIDIKEYLI